MDIDKYSIWVAASDENRPGPVVVMGRITHLPTVQVAPLARKAGAEHPNEVLIPQGIGGVAEDSVVFVHRIRTIRKECLHKLIGQLPEEQGEQIKDCVCYQLLED